MCSRAGWCGEGAAGGKEEAGPGQEGLRAFGFDSKVIGKPLDSLKQEGVLI